MERIGDCFNDQQRLGGCSLVSPRFPSSRRGTEDGFRLSPGHPNKRQRSHIDCANERKKEEMKMSKDEVNKKYRGKYVEIEKSYDHIQKCYKYIVLKSYSKIQENTTLGEDVGTSMEYCR